MTRLDTETQGFTYDYPRPAVTVDVVVFGAVEERLSVLLIRRRDPPFQGRWAIPGGFVDIDEPLETAARRELAEETGVTDLWLEQLYTFGEPGRDPRGRVLTVAYMALVPADRLPTVQAGDDAEDARWFDMDGLPDMAFDHDDVLAVALQRLRTKLEYTTVSFQLMPESFTLSRLQGLYENILGRPLDKRNFRRKMLALGILEPLNVRVREGRTRPAQLYRFVAERFENLRDRGILFPF